MEISVLASGSSGNCYHVDDGRSALLIECGIPWAKIQKALAFRTYRIAACLVSHEHQDHSRSVLEVLRNGIPVCASDGTIKALGIPETPGYVWDVRSGTTYETGPWRITGFAVEHDAAEPWGFVVEHRNTEKLVYLTDTAYSRWRFPGVSHYMVEANYSGELVTANIEAGVVHPAMKPRLLQTHMSIDTCRQLLLANDLSMVVGIWLLHLSDRNSDAEGFRRTIQEATGKPVYIA